MTGPKLRVNTRKHTTYSVEGNLSLLMEHGTRGLASTHPDLEHIRPTINIHIPGGGDWSNMSVDPGDLTFTATWSTEEEGAE